MWCRFRCGYAGEVSYAHNGERKGSYPVANSLRRQSAAVVSVRYVWLHLPLIGEKRVCSQRPSLGIIFAVIRGTRNIEGIIQRRGAQLSRRDVGGGEAPREGRKGEQQQRRPEK
jgi:phage gp37-like protein